ncbi:periplasmic heavy metal sensor [Thiofilum flexile]|uniref:periplasmic heavy metal sensor n=1 Tax=Thiofilum flexile TaxID=125627 RepID=UPI00035ED487|nr:periplasmic heavy metal sensor [Thiofilum flexile]
MKRFVLIGSLLLNIFFIIWAGSQWLKNRLISDSLLAHTMQTVPVVARPVFQRHLRNNKDELLHNLQQLRSGRQAINHLLQQTELDSAALDQALIQSRADLNKIVEQLQSAMAATMKELPPEARREWSQQWQQGDGLLTQAIAVLTRELEK